MAEANGYALDVAAPRVVASLEKYAVLSEAVDLSGATLDVSYGPDPRQAYDVFPAGRDTPAIVHFHGGYWKAGTKEARRFPAPIWQAQGVTWITVEYRLCPHVTLDEIAADACAALSHVADHAADYGIDPSRLHVTGHSAGAHLAAMAAATSNVKVASLGVTSGLFDLEPLRHAGAQSWLNLTPETARALSPIHHPVDLNLPVVVAWGADESDAFEAQSTGFAAHCGPLTETLICPGADHFEVIAAASDPDHPLFKALLRLITQI